MSDEKPGDEPDVAPTGEPGSEAEPATAEQIRTEAQPDVEAQISAEAQPSTVSDDLPPAGPPPPGSVPLPEPPKPLRMVPPAQIDDVIPDQGPVVGDTKVTLTGAHLYRESLVRIGGAIARTVGADEPHRLHVLTPPSDKPGSVDVSVQNPNADVVVSKAAFRYLALAPPKIVSIAPNHLPVAGGEITIVGSGFVPTTQVLLDGAPASGARFVDDTTLDVKIPGGSHGATVDVVVKNPDGKQAVERRAFAYDERYG